MIDVVEDMKNEFKEVLTDKLESEIIAFLNTKGGNIYIGVNDSGEVVGVKNADLVQRTIKDRLKDNIAPSIVGIYDVVVEEYEDKKYIRITVPRGCERPYYLRGMGMTPDSCFIRIGSAIQSMPKEMIETEFSKRLRKSIKNIIAPKQDLTFEQLKIYYEEHKHKINTNFLKQLDFYTDDGKYNYVAYLFSDNNDVSIRYGKYEGVDVGNLIRYEEFGECCLIKAMNNIMDALRVENVSYTKIGFPERKTIKKFDYDVVREAIVNSLVHNDWTRGYGPKIEVFSDRLVISSYGGLQEGVSEEEFLSGLSSPLNREVMRVFKDIGLVEQMGTGIMKMLKVYDKSIFKFFPHFIVVSIPFNENEFEKERIIKQEKNYMNSESYLSVTQKHILSLMMSEPTITQNELANRLDVNLSTIKRNMKELVKMNFIKRVGETKASRWHILKEINEVDSCL